MRSQKVKSGARRQAATCNGLKKRVRDLVFEQVADPRIAGKVDYRLPTMLTALVASMATMARSLRAVEQRTGQMALKQGQWNGQVVTYHLWRYDLSDDGWLDWTHARQLVRIHRTAECQRTGEVTAGNRYYVRSRSPDTMSPRTALATCRAHWRCENNTHWTSDAELWRTGAGRHGRVIHRAAWW